MPEFTATATHPLDIAARAAFRHLCDFHGKAHAAQLLAANPRTIERIYSGQRYLPPSIAREAADHFPGDEHRQLRADLRAWFDYCQQEGQ